MQSGSKKARARDTSSRGIIIDPKKLRISNNGLFKCSCCGKEYTVQKGNFLITNSSLFANNGGFLTICKECGEKFYLQMVGYYSGNTDLAMERCCQIFDWYYSPDILAMMKNADARVSSVTALYATKMNLIQFRKNGKPTTYMDTVKDKTERILDSTDIQQETSNTGGIDDTYNENVGEAPVNIETVKFFGYGYKPEEYEYLETQYQDWSTRYECKTKAQEELFKNICIAQLSIQRAQKKGIAKEVNDTMKTFQDLLGTANIRPNQSNDNAVTEQNSVGTLIKKWENERPISQPSPEWEDVDGIKKYIDTFFLGHLCNLVHITNDNEEAYRKEMAKYTVSKPVYEEDEENETSLLDRYSNKGDKSQ